MKDDWPFVAVYLKSTGRLAREVACPSPGGDGCPRTVVRHGDGRLRAVCGSKPAECDPVDVTRDDITCLTLDRAKLAAAIGAILGADLESDLSCRDRSVLVGSHGVAAGIGIPVVLMIPGPMEVMTEEELRELNAGSGPVAIVVPTRRSLSARVIAAFAAQSHETLYLSDIATVQEHQLVGIRPADQLLKDLRKKLLATPPAPAAGRAWLLPADARWEELVFEFSARESLNIRFRGDTRMFDPQVLGMKRIRTGKPTSQWALLQAFAQNIGEIGWSSPESRDEVKKQKQLLSKRLILAFGITDEPIVWDRRAGAYRTRFKISGTPLGFRRAQAARR